MKALAMALMCASLPAYALQKPEPAVKGGDPHVQVVTATPGEPVLVVGAVGRSLAITFPPNENIRRVLLENDTNVDGKPLLAPWQGPSQDSMSLQPLGHVLPLWAVRAGRSTAQIITGPDDKIYPFVLIALPQQPDTCAADDCDDPRMTSSLTFRFTPERKAPDQTVQRAQYLVHQKAAAEGRLKSDIFYGQRNWSYGIKGKAEAVKRIAPDQTSDNSQVTGFRYIGNRHLPALFIVEPGKEERTVTVEPDKDLMVLYEAIPACPTFPKALSTCTHFTLRSGDDVVDIYNTGKETAGENPGTGTISPEVLRVTRATPADSK